MESNLLEQNRYRKYIYIRTLLCEQLFFLIIILFLTVFPTSQPAKDLKREMFWALQDQVP